MTRAVETVTTNRIFLVQLVGQCIHVCIIRHGLVESRIEDSHLRHARQTLLYRVNTLQVSGVMQRSEVHTLNNLRLHFRRDEHGLIEFLASMDYAVTHRVDLLEVLDASDLRIHQFLENQLNTYGMLRHRLLEFHLLAIRQFDQQERIRQTDFLDTALRHHALALHVEEFVLDTTAAAVEN